jgi:hypothetical protein
MHNFLATCLIVIMSLLPTLVMATDAPVECCQDQVMATSMDQEDSCCCEPGSCIDMGQSCQCDTPQLNPFRKTAINPDLLLLGLKRLKPNAIESPSSPFSDGLYRPPIIL